MPYIPSLKKELIDQDLDKLKSKLSDGKGNIDFGCLEYLIYRLMYDLTQENKCFNTMNQMIGTLETTKATYNHKVLNPYEDNKLSDNWLQDK